MPSFTQDGRLIRVESPLGTDVLLLDRFSGEEGISVPYHYTARMLSLEEEIDPASILREPMALEVDTEDGGRWIHGRVRRFVQLGQNEEFTVYEAEIVPWLWFLGLSSDCRIFQGLTVPEIIAEVFDGLGYSDYEFRTTGSYETREFCVQYRETHLNFVSRLLEEEGIFYYFEHSDSKHTLVLADANSSLEPAPGQSEARMAVEAGSWQEEDVVLSLRAESRVHPGSVTLRDYDFTRPSLSLQSNAPGDGEELYDYPGRYLQLSEGDRYAQLILEESQHQKEVVVGSGQCRSFQSGYTFTLAEHYRKDTNREYLLVSIRHSASGGDFRSRGKETPGYNNDFLAIPSDTPFRPPRTARKPRIHGTQTALVVGPGGEEIHTDEYGRVKVHFHWDRLDDKDEHSSCWVRVSYPWAGKGWGGIHIPRIGQEVIVEFLEGDPDRPIITGRVYNAEQPVPYALPDNKTQSGIKSRSSKEGGGENFNEIRMEDKKGEELFYVHAEKDKREAVENDRSETVGNDETVTIGNDQTISVGNDRTEDVGNKETISIGADRSESVGGNESITVGGSRTESVGESETITVAKDQSISVGESASVSIGKDGSLTIGKDATETVGGKRVVKVSKEASIDAKKIQLIAKDQITLKAGKAQLVLKKNGDIMIKGKKIQIKGSGDVIVKGSKIGQN